MKAEIISVGTELLLGQTVNTDTAIIARELSPLGIDLLHSSVVGDNPQRLKAEIDTAISRSDIVIMTGGLGPTQDDLTKETAAACAGKKLVLHKDSMDKIMTYFNGMDISENQKKQAMLPEGCTVIENNNGTAPGCAFETENKAVIIMLPGPPSELEPMMKESVIPLLRKRQDSVIVSHNVHVYGRGEAMVAQMMDDLMESENPTLAPYAKDGEMFLRVTAKSKDEKAAEELCAPLIEEIKKRVGSYVYGVDANTLEELVVKLLKKKKKKIAVAESCTGGLLAKRITDVAGSSEVFELGCVTYANSVKEKILGVERLKLEKHGAVSPEVAVEMAEGVRKLSDADIGIGITGIAGPGGGTDEKPVGLVYIALSDGKETFVNKRNPVRRNKDRDWHRLTAASSALDMVRRYLTGLDVIPKD